MVCYRVQLQAVWKRWAVGEKRAAGISVRLDRLHPVLYRRSTPHLRQALRTVLFSGLTHGTCLLPSTHCCLFNMWSQYLFSLLLNFINVFVSLTIYCWLLRCNVQVMKEIAVGTKTMEMVGLCSSLVLLSISIFIFCYFR